MTHDAETVERVAKAIYQRDTLCVWHDATVTEREKHTDLARAALSAIPPQEVSIPDLLSLFERIASCPVWLSKDNTILPDVLKQLKILRALSEKPHE